MILIQCLKCGKNYALTEEQIVAGEYAQIFRFLAEHGAHFTESRTRTLDVAKLREALRLLRESVIE